MVYNVSYVFFLHPMQALQDSTMSVSGRKVRFEEKLPPVAGGGGAAGGAGGDSSTTAEKSWNRTFSSNKLTIRWKIAAESVLLLPWTRMERKDTFEKRAGLDWDPKTQAWTGK